MTDTRLRVMAATSLPAWLETSMAEYVASRIRSGETEAQAEVAMRKSVDTWFPGGTPAPGHHVWDVVDGDDTVVGSLWIGPFEPAGRDWWVFDIEIAEAHRRRGHARRALEQAHVVAKDAGAASIGLNVFGYNTGAAELYEQLGYGVTSVQMKLPLN